MESSIVGECHEIVIVGGGICGLATALALHREGMRSIILEKSEILRATGAGIITQPNGWQALHRLGVASLLRQTAIPIQSGQYISVDNGKREEIPLGGELRCLKRTDLVKALSDNLPDNTIHFGRKVVSIEIDGFTSDTTIQLHDGSTLTAKVVIGCDGINSIIASKLGLSPTKLILTCVVRGFTYYPNGHEFGSKFLVFSKDRVQLGQLSVTQNLVYWFVTRKSTSQDDTISRDQVLIKNSTLESIKGFPWHAEEMIKGSDLDSLHLTDVRFRAPWDLLRASFRRGTVTVAGDAMHAMGPFLAQGGSASLEDAIVLARCLAKKMHTQPNGIGVRKMVEEALDQYGKQRKMRVFWLSLQTYLIGTTLDTSSTLIKILNIFVLTLLFRDPIGHISHDFLRL